MKTRRELFAFSAMVVTAGLSALTAHAEDRVKMGFIYPSPVGDVGWAHELDKGRMKIVEKFGDKVETMTAENIPSGPDAIRTMNKMIADGVKLLMIGDFGYMNDGLQLAKQYPDVAIINASGYKLDANFGNFKTRSYESSYIAGIAAGAVTKSNVLGVVAAYPMPEIIGIINTFTVGAQKVNPDITVKIVWLNSWFDPTKSQKAGRSLVAAQADVLFSLYQDTPEVVVLAEELGVHSISTSSDMKEYAPEKYLLGLGIDWGPYFTDVAGQVLAGTFKGTSYWGGMKDRAVYVASLTSELTPEVTKLAHDAIAAITAGIFHPMTGPIVDQDGVEKLADGVVIADGEMASINWLVKGVETRLP